MLNRTRFAIDASGCIVDVQRTTTTTTMNATKAKSAEFRVPAASEEQQAVRREPVSRRTRSMILKAAENMKKGVPGERMDPADFEKYAHYLV